MAVKLIFSSSGQQIMQEVCEHCGDPIRQLHISDIATVKDNEIRTVSIRNADEELFQLKTRREKIKEVTESFKRKQLLDDTEAEEAFQKKAFKHGMRPEAMCSESIDPISGVTQSYCHKLTRTKVLNKVRSDGTTFSASFSRATASRAGIRVGMDRKGNPIRMKEIKEIDMDTGRVKKIINDAGQEVEKPSKKLGAFEKGWWNELSPDEQDIFFKLTITCERFVDTYGKDAVFHGKAITQFESKSELQDQLEFFGCPNGT